MQNINFRENIEKITELIVIVFYIRENDTLMNASDLHTLTLVHTSVQCHKYTKIKALYNSLSLQKSYKI